jgi:AcrR family transcriptional regulator
MDGAGDRPVDEKDAAILRAAFDVFADYGFRRASMEDIARRAGMSRPALYLRYSGKEDIFRALVRLHFAGAEAGVVQALNADVPPEATLLAVYQAIDGHVAQAMLDSPHAAEMLDMKLSMAKDEIAAGEQRIVAHLADWISRGIAAEQLSIDGLGGSAAEVAATILAAKTGLKMPGVRYADYRAGQARLAAMFGRALIG